jgi:hypothetical protein
MKYSRGTADRVLLALAGTTLTAGGLWTVAARVAPARLPARWPAPGAVPLDRDAVAPWRAEGWWAPAVIGACLVLTAFLSWWFVTRISHSGRLRASRRARLPLDVPGSTLRLRALRDTVDRRARAVAGVDRCRVAVRARRGRRLSLRLRVWLAADTSPAAVLGQLTAVMTETGRTVVPYEVGSRVRISRSRTPRHAPRVH